MYIIGKILETFTELIGRQEKERRKMTIRININIKITNNGSFQPSINKQFMNGLNTPKAKHWQSWLKQANNMSLKN
jgi:hypothetical protein